MQVTAPQNVSLMQAWPILVVIAGSCLEGTLLYMVCCLVVSVLWATFLTGTFSVNCVLLRGTLLLDID